MIGIEKGREEEKEEVQQWRRKYNEDTRKEEKKNCYNLVITSWILLMSNKFHLDLKLGVVLLLSF